MEWGCTPPTTTMWTHSSISKPIQSPCSRVFVESFICSPFPPLLRKFLGGWKFQPSRSSWWPVHPEAVSIPHSKSPPQHKLRYGQKDPLWGIRETSINQKIPRLLGAVHEHSETKTQDVSYTAEGRAFQAKRNAQARAENYDSSLASCRYICLLVY